MCAWCAGEGLYPQLLLLGAACATAAEGVTEGGAELPATTPSSEEGRAVTGSKPGHVEESELAGDEGGGLAAAGGVGTSGGSAVPPASGVKAWKQEKNVHALTVLRRIKCKLDGRDKWPGKERESKQTVTEQVETVIKQATSLDNLCLLYEGWSPWL